MKNRGEKMNMNGCNCSGCGCGFVGRGFLTKEERVEMLKEYKENLDQEAKAVAERIKELEKSK